MSRPHTPGDNLEDVFYRTNLALFLPQQTQIFSSSHSYHNYHLWWWREVVYVWRDGKLTLSWRLYFPLSLHIFCSNRPFKITPQCYIFLVPWHGERQRNISHNRSHTCIKWATRGQSEVDHTLPFPLAQSLEAHWKAVSCVLWCSGKRVPRRC